ncbi:MAG: nucleotide exchange factor GrpE [Candidatus Wenzhouxiangella sp. M2_3B_020]
MNEDQDRDIDSVQDNPRENAVEDDAVEPAEIESAEDAKPAPDESEELARIKETMVRMQAEMENREKRLEREMAKSRKFALESLMRDFVQVLDSMDQALSSADREDAGVAYEGMELTRKQAVQVLTAHGLEVLDPVGEPFDPNWHEAMATQPTEEQEPDTVFQVLQKGYRLNERLIRPARVIVAKAP